MKFELKIKNQKKMISKFGRKFLNLNSVLESLKEQCAYLIDDKICISSTLGENFKIMEDDTCLILKVQIENLKEWLTHSIRSHGVVSINSSVEREKLRKYFK